MKPVDEGRLELMALDWLRIGDASAQVEEAVG